MARSRELKVVISGDPSQLTRAFAKAGTGASQLEARVGKASTGIGRSLVSMGKVGTVALGGGLVVALKESIDAFAESERVAKQTEAVLKSTGGAAHVTAKQIGDLATAISKKSGMDDEAIQSGENLLLTFTNIQNATGKGNDIFNQTVSIMADLSTALGQDTKSSAIQLGKALNDPVKGVTALQRVGVSFTQQQKDQIKTLVESGRTLDAQKLILAELRKEFGGSAAAAGDSFAGKINKAKVAVGNLGEAIGGALAPAIGTAADLLAGFVDKLASSDRPAKFFGSVKGFADDAKAAVDGLFHTFDALKSTRGSAGAAIGEMFADAFENIDWRGIGDKISAGVSAAFQFSSKMSDAIAQGISTAASHVDGRKALSGLLRVVAEALDALFSPSFWIENFKSIFAVVTFVIPVGKILKVPGFGVLFNFISKPMFRAVAAVGEGLLTLFGRVGSRAFTAFLAELEKLAPRTANVMLRVSTGGAKAVASFPGKIIGVASRAVGGFADKLGDGIGKVAGVMARLVGRALSPLSSAVGRFASAGARIGRAIVDAIVGAIRGAAGAVGSALQSLVPKGVRNAANKVGGAAKSLINSITGGATGAYIDAPPSHGDSVPALLKGGEVVLNQRQQAMVGPASIFAALRATGAKVIGPGGGPARLAGGGVIGPQTVSRMQSAARGWVGLPYVYGGGHSGFGPSGGGFDCSGFVSAVLGVGGAIGSPMSVRQPLQGALLPGPGKYVTVGIRGTRGRQAHTMIKVGNRYFEAASHGVVESGGWRGSFDLFHPANEATTGGDASGDPGQAGGSSGSATRKVQRDKFTPAAGSGGGTGNPTPFEMASAGAELAVAQAGTTSSTADDINALSGQQSVIGDRIAKIRNALKKKLSPKTRVRLQQELAQLIPQYGALGGQIDELRKPAAPSVEDYINADLVAASLTPDQGDDIAQTERLRNFYKGKYDEARGSGDIAGQLEFGPKLKSAQDSLDQLTKAIQDDSEQRQRLIDLTQQQVDNQNKLLAFSQQAPQLMAAVVAAVTGDIGGRVGLGFQSPGYAGGVARY